MLIPRLASSTAIIALFALAIALKGTIGEIIFILAALFISFFLAKELSEIISKINHVESSRIIHFVSAIFIALLYLSDIFGRFGKDQFFIFAAFSVVIFFWLKILFDFGKKDKIASNITDISVFFLIIIPASCIYKIYSFSDKGLDGRLLFLYFIAVTKSADIGGYVGGMLSNKIMKKGNHKILPGISPKKSWEGTIIGLALSVFVSAMIWKTVFGQDFNNLFAFVFGAILFAGSFLGDISESVLKRAAEIKDSGNTIPGIGGVLDLMDSFIFNAPTFYIFISMLSM